MPSYIGLDFETYCDLDLTKVGLDNYVNHPSFEPLIAGVFYENGARLVFNFWDAGQKDPNERQRVLEKFHHVVKTTDTIWAQNRMFETRVLRHMGIEHPNILDSAVVARALGAGSSLEFAAPQLVDTDKDFNGKRLIQKFSMPQKDGTRVLDNMTPEDYQDMHLFEEYCVTDAQLSAQIGEGWGGYLPEEEHAYERLTAKINETGWFVDMDLVKQMEEIRARNLFLLEDRFAMHYGAVNFNSPQQLTKFCKERRVRISSWTQESVDKYLKVVEKEFRKRHGELTRHSYTDQQREDIIAVWDLLQTKHALGGSALSKLPKIREMTSTRDGRLRDQYVHVGAGQTFRTSGRAAQLQNLKRLGRNVADVSDPEVLHSMTNDELGDNLRQVFRAEHPQGAIVVADFSAVESRGLAYLAGAKWKLDAFEQGLDMYKMQWVEMAAAQGKHVHYADVDAEGRRGGKLGELSCGYGAGVNGVSSFAEQMGMDLSRNEIQTTVDAWRESNPEIVEFWKNLDTLLWQAVEHSHAVFFTGVDDSVRITASTVSTPSSLVREARGFGLEVTSLRVRVSVAVEGSSTYRTIVTRYFPGVFVEGRQLCYHKPSGTQSGPLWKNEWREKNQRGRYTIYGGKLAGILTQSLCREVFFDRLYIVDQMLMHSFTNARLCGQLHDEINVEWRPLAHLSDEENQKYLQKLEDMIQQAMSEIPMLPGFPLAVEVSSDFRYIK